jgi:hypothetical protein
VGRVPVRLSLEEQGLAPYSVETEKEVEANDDTAVQFNEGSITINLKLLMKNGIKKLTINL